MDSKQIILKYILVATIGYMQINASYPGTIPETCVQAFKPAKRLGVRPEAEGGLDTIHPYVKPRKPGAALHPCKEFSETSCCSNVGAQEIGDGFEHLMNIGGSGGVPVDDERCYLKAKAEHIALKDYFCLYCNPYQANYMGCCDHVANDTMSCVSGFRKFGDSGCGKDDTNTVRICKSFAEDLWWEREAGKTINKDGSKYDGCGMMMWVADPVPVEDPANPNNWLAWGALEGKHGDDPVTPSVTWSGDYKQFFRDVKPPIFDQFYVIVVDDADGGCFKGFVHKNAGSTASHVVSYSKFMYVFIGIIASFYLY